jgi:hypothetical protein
MKMKMKVNEGTEGLHENGTLWRAMIQYRADIFAVSSLITYCSCM